MVIASRAGIINLPERINTGAYKANIITGPAGSGRSGSTLIDIILGQIPGCCPVGEIRDIWEY